MTVSSGIITKIAGTDTASYSGDGGAATSAALNKPYGVAIDSSSNVYIADSGNNRIRKVTITTPTRLPTVMPSIPTITPSKAPSLTPTLIPSYAPSSAATTSSQDIITTIAGTGSASYSGDGGAATSAGVYYPSGVALDASGIILFLFIFN